MMLSPERLHAEYFTQADLWQNRLWSLKRRHADGLISEEEYRASVSAGLKYEEDYIEREQKLKLCRRDLTVPKSLRNDGLITEVEYGELREGKLEMISVVFLAGP